MRVSEKDGGQIRNIVNVIMSVKDVIEKTLSHLVSVSKFFYEMTLLVNTVVVSLQK